MVKEDTIEFENDIPKKHNAKIPHFSPEEELPWKKSCTNKL